MLVNSTNLFTVEKIFDENTILTCSAYFPDCLPSLSTDLRDAEGANIGDPCLEDAYTGVFYIKGSGIKGASTKSVCIVGACSGGACIRGVCIGGACDVGNCIRSADIGGICGSTYKLSEFSV